MSCTSFKKPLNINALKLTFKILETIYIKTHIRQKIPNRCVKREPKTH